MNESLASLRKAKGLSQEDLGNAIARRLKRPIGVSYAQKKIARFEAGTAAPTADEIRALAAELDLELEILASVISPRAPHEAVTIIHQFAPSAENGRSLIASCMLSRPRSQSLDETLRAIKEVIEEKSVSIATFVPYPGKFNLPETSNHTDHLVGRYAQVKKSILDANLAFKNALRPDRAEAVALYFPKAEANILIPPVLRQFTLNVEVAPGGIISKTLHIWTPGAEADAARPIKATGVYSLEEQIEAWESFFGDIMSHWIETNRFLASDAYWTKVR